MTPLRVCLNARLISGQPGGVEQINIGLASGFSQLTDGNEEYLFLTYADADTWLRPYLSGPCRLLPSPSFTQERQWKENLINTFPNIYAFWNRFGPALQTINGLKSDRILEKSGATLVHFTTQPFFLTAIPFIYQLYDLQHIYFPDFFCKRVRLSREFLYRTFCERATAVAVMSCWGKKDLIRHYGLAPDKVIVVPGASVVSANSAPSTAELGVVRHKFSLPDYFIFYPAQTWAHKNHIGLVKALAILHERHNLTINVVCSGKKNEFFPSIERQIRAQRLVAHVHFLGFITPFELRCLYRLCRLMVFPSKFEGFGLPVVEAFSEGAPVACSNATCLPEIAGNAALLFDPDDPEEIAETIYRLWMDETLRREMIARGRKRATQFSWERTARTFRAHYRRIAGRQLTEDDRALIELSMRV